MIARLLLFVVFLPVLVFAQEQDSVWSLIQGGPLFESCYDIARAPDNHVWMVGTWFDQPDQFMDWYVLRLAPDRQIAGQWTIPTPEMGSCNGVLPVRDDLTILYGNEDNYAEAIVLAWDDHGDTLWETSFESGGEMLGFSCALVTPDSALLLCGSHSITGDGLLTQIWMVKMSFAGDTIWTRRYGDSNLDYARDVVPTPDGGFLVVGMNGISDGSIPYIPEVIKTGSAGDSLWGHQYGRQDEFDEWPNAVIPIDQGYLIAGMSEAFGPPGVGWLMRIDDDGNFLGDQVIQPDNFQNQYSMFNDVLRAGDNQIVLVGECDIWNSNQVYGWMVGLDDAGGVVWNRVYGSGYGRLQAAIPADSGGLTIGGQDWSRGTSDFWLLETRPALTSAGEQKIPAADQWSLAQNYPNPFNSSTTIAFTLPQASLATLKIFDLTGRQVATVTDENYAAGTHTVLFDASALPSGVYVYRLAAGDFRQSQKMIALK